MGDVTFITGNEHKARFLRDFLGMPIEHKKLELDELQSLDLEEIVKHKVSQAYDLLKTPVLVEDVGLVINSLGRLPGPFIKWFEQELGLQSICDLVGDDRSAAAQIAFGYFDGEILKTFHGTIEGLISASPRGKSGFGWNPIFIPNGADKTYAEMDDDETLKFSLRTTTVFPEIESFLKSLSR